MRILIEKSGDRVNNLVERFFRHLGVKRQGEDLIGDPIGNAQIVSTTVLEKTHPMSGLPVDTDIDAVFFLTNYLGVLGIEVIKKLQIRVPEQLAVICFDDNDIFRLYTPTISVIRQPIEEIGKKAMSQLVERLRHTGEETYPISAPVQLTADLIARESI